MALHKRHYTDKTLTMRKSMYVCERASLDFFSRIFSLKLLFLSIFCWYFRYVVGKNGMLVGLHVPTNFQMYPRPPPPPPPPRIR